ncbi:MAG: glycosyltransferase family 4 protein [Planctomycetota bacterium]
MKFGFYSCMSGMPWGGSEVLWQRAARKLMNEGHQVAVNFKYWAYKAEPLQLIEDKGGSVYYRDKPPESFLQKWFPKNGTNASWLEQEKPDAVLITLGYHPDPILIANECIRLGIPYGINLQCASNFFFVHGDRVDDYQKWYRHAKKVFFVSQENQDKLQNNIAMLLDNAEIIANPFNVSYQANPEWPSTEPEFRIALVGRIHFQSKGQDLVVDVLKQAKWRKRNIKVTFYGHDQGNKRQLIELINLYDLQDKLDVGGYSENVEGIWADNHALLLPSRYEGAPLVVIEAMLCNRIAITTDIGRNRELIDDNESGFVALAATVELLDDALERAWQMRNQWKQMGELAGTHIRQRYPEDPVAEYAERIKSLAPVPVTS